MSPLKRTAPPLWSRLWRDRSFKFSSSATGRTHFPTGLRAAFFPCVRSRGMMFRIFFRRWGSLVAGLRTAWRPLPAMDMPPRDCRSSPRSHLDERLASERGIRPTRIVRKRVKGRVAPVARPAKDDAAAPLPSPRSFVPGGRRRPPSPRRECQQPLSVRRENRMSGVCAPRRPPRHVVLGTGSVFVEPSVSARTFEFGE